MPASSPSATGCLSSAMDSDQEIRRACIELVMPDLANPDMGLVIEKADKIFHYIKNGAGAPKRRGRPTKADKLK